MDIENLIDKYDQGYVRLKEQIDNLPAGSIDYKPTPDSWSIRSVVAHIADSEANAYIRGRRIIAESGAEIMSYDQMEWSRKLFYEDLNIDHALVLIKVLRQQMVSVLKKLSPEAWKNYVIHPKSGHITLEDWIELYTDHIENHIQQIHRNLYDFNKEGER